MITTIELKGIKEALQTLDPENVRRAARRTIKRAAGSGKTIISKIIREKYNIKKKDLDEKISVKIGDMFATLTLTGKPLNLADFGAREFGKRGRKGSGVRVRILKGGKITRLKAFMGKGRGSGAIFVFRRIPGTQSPFAPISKRTGRPWKREKLRVLKVIGYPSMLRRPENIQAVEARIREQLEKEWQANIKYYGQKGGE
jgi:hypothetical protein